VSTSPLTAGETDPQFARDALCYSARPDRGIKGMEMTERARRFVARHTDVVVEGVGSDLLVFDRRTDTAHCLGEAAALVWRSCESGATLNELAEMLVAHKLVGSSDEGTALAEAALSELDETELLETSLRPGGMPRRQALRRIAKVGAIAVSAPLIVSATAQASPASCQGNSGGSCVTVPCCSGFGCVGGGECLACTVSTDGCNSNNLGEYCCDSGVGQTAGECLVTSGTDPSNWTFGCQPV
jgi:hypothetical protein